MRETIAQLKLKLNETILKTKQLKDFEIGVGEYPWRYFLYFSQTASTLLILSFCTFSIFFIFPVSSCGGLCITLAWLRYSSLHKEVRFLFFIVGKVPAQLFQYFQWQLQTKDVWLKVSFTWFCCITGSMLPGHRYS